MRLKIFLAMLLRQYISMLSLTTNCICSTEFTLHLLLENHKKELETTLLLK